jgi:hypothetical protein
MDRIDPVLDREMWRRALVKAIMMGCSIKSSEFDKMRLYQLFWRDCAVHEVQRSII